MGREHSAAACSEHSSFCRLIAAAWRLSLYMDSIRSARSRRSVKSQPKSPLPSSSLPNQKQEIKKEATRASFLNLEREKSLELSTSTLARLRSTN
jgi:hypothetical protein